MKSFITKLAIELYKLLPADKKFLFVLCVALIALSGVVSNYFYRTDCTEQENRIVKLENRVQYLENGGINYNKFRFEVNNDLLNDVKQIKRDLIRDLQPDKVYSVAIHYPRGFEGDFLVMNEKEVSILQTINMKGLEDRANNFMFQNVKVYEFQPYIDRILSGNTQFVDTLEHLKDDNKIFNTFNYQGIKSIGFAPLSVNDDIGLLGIEYTRSNHTLTDLEKLRFENYAIQIGRVLKKKYKQDNI